MSLVFACQDVPPAPWIRALQAELPDLEVYVWPDHGDAEAVEFALIWGPHAAEMGRFPNLKAMISLGAGVDHILEQRDRPPDVPIVRLVDPGLRTGMLEYVLYAVFRYHRRMPEYEMQQKRRVWIERRQYLPSERRIGILGLGEIGTVCAEVLERLGFDVIGWSRTKKEIHNVGCFYGNEALAAFLGQSSILICLLPLTPETAGVLNRDAFAALPPGAYLINVGRGGHVVEEDLMAALDSGHVAGATLDVFQTEPLPRDHPFWTHPNVTVTPHIAALTLPQTAAPTIAEIIQRARAGRPLLNVVDPERGY